MDLRPGDEVFGPTADDNYKIIRPIGNGAFGIVYEVTDKHGTKFALKTIVTAWLNGPELQTLDNEGKLSVGIQHPNIVRVLYFHDGKTYPQLPPYMIMEFAEGGTLEDLLNGQRSKGGFYKSEELKALLLQLSSGMKALNEKLVHRDIKLDNILLVEGELKISDFGLSKLVGAATRSKTFKGINHLKYCAPEAWRLEANTPAMDMYSMGIVFYEIATLQHPYKVEESGDLVEAWKNAHLFQQAKDIRFYNKDIDITLSQIIMKMISKRPEYRYHSWDDVIERLQYGENLSSTLRDINSIVNTAIESHRKAEQSLLNAKNESINRKELENIVEYCFHESIISAVEQTVDSFNLASDFVKLSLVQGYGSFSIQISGRVGSKRVNAKVVAIHEKYYLDNRLIKAWGHVKSPNGRGFNLLLVNTNADDLYGRWETLHVRHSPLVRTEDGRLEPFPFDTHELPKEIRLLNAFHIYKTTQDIFKPEMLDPLIQELF